VELRRFIRAPLDQSLLFAKKDDDEFIEGLARDISLGGMFIETPMPAEFGAEIVIHITLPEQSVELALPAVVRWTRVNGMGIQFRLLGARETHAITEVVRVHSGSR
jgi:Tfp pilus assembly protein PilZ